MSFTVSKLSPERLALAKAAYTTRRVRFEEAVGFQKYPARINAGDLLLARVKKIGQHQRIELANGRRARLFVGDEIIVCYGNRYAPQQFEAVIPDSMTTCDLVAAGGIAARTLSKHGKMKQPTVITPKGILCDGNERPLNAANFAEEKIYSKESSPLVLAVVGTTMDAGKTTTAAYLIQGLIASGMKVGAAKVTGTGAGGDLWFMKDAGANPVFDIIDAGYVSTYRVDIDQVIGITGLLTSRLRNADVDAIVLEVADGLYQEETAGLLSSSQFKNIVDGVIFASDSAVGAKMGMMWLQEHGLPMLALSGAVTRSPLAVIEAKEATGLPVLNLESLSCPSVSSVLKKLQGMSTELQRVPFSAVGVA